MDFSNLFRHETETVNFSSGETILKCGEMSDVMYVMLEGEAEVRLGEQVIYTAQTGTLLGELGLIDHIPGSADVIARTDCRLVAIDKRRFLFLIQQTPNFALDVMKVIAERLRAMNHHAMESLGNR
ncbi:MAG: cyclic nucleotide-binding domain-containing protein [Gammaproteobacteria bacterium]|nr:cyclic nucleotide-binding domain-containing protein [Gammaproteobacteria bacterium]MBU1980431.1 cyclic nucleotide-binding domain-containing protein [Gammaproteobacteria bacterium]